MTKKQAPTTAKNKTAKEFTIEQAEKMIAEKKAKEAAEIKAKMDEHAKNISKMLEDYCNTHNVMRVFAPQIVEGNKIKVHEFIVPKK